MKNTKVQNNVRTLRGHAMMLVCAVLAFFASIILMVSTRFAFFELTRGPAETTGILQEEEGAFVSMNVRSVLGYYHSRTNSSGAIIERYAIVPAEDKLVTVVLTNRYLHSADAVLVDTLEYLSGRREELVMYFTVEGTVSELGDRDSGRMYEWFRLNMPWLIQTGAIAETDDFSDYLSDRVLFVDTVRSVSHLRIIVSTLIAALCFLYAASAFAVYGILYIKARRREALRGSEGGE